MDAVEILLLVLVGLSVLFFLILDHLDPPHRGAFIQSGGESVGGGGDAEKEAAAEVLEREEEFIDDDDDDWEGVERSELEKIFGEAMVYVNSSKTNNNNFIINGEDVQLQLYGLERVALEGPCYGSQPMALQLSARSKWSAWHKLGNMSPETAMEKYVHILSEAIPDWNYLRSNTKGKDIAFFEDPSDNIDEVDQVKR